MCALSQLGKKSWNYIFKNLQRTLRLQNLSSYLSEIIHHWRGEIFCIIARNISSLILEMLHVIWIGRLMIQWWLCCKFPAGRLGNPLPLQNSPPRLLAFSITFHYCNFSCWVNFTFVSLQGAPLHVLHCIEDTFSASFSQSSTQKIFRSQSLLLNNQQCCLSTMHSVGHHISEGLHLIYALYISPLRVCLESASHIASPTFHYAGECRRGRRWGAIAHHHLGFLNVCLFIVNPIGIALTYLFEVVASAPCSKMLRFEAGSCGEFLLVRTCECCHWQKEYWE